MLYIKVVIIPAYIALYLYFSSKVEPLHSLLPVYVCVQMFKGFDKAKDIQYVYTPVFSSLCGVKLDSNNKAGYLLSGTVCNGQVLFCTFSRTKQQKVQQKGHIM